MTEQIERKIKEKKKKHKQKQTHIDHHIQSQEVSGEKFDYLVVLLTTIDKRTIEAIYASDARS